MKYKISSKITLAIVLLSFVTVNVWSQNNEMAYSKKNDEEPYIAWVKQYPEPKTGKQKQNLLHVLYTRITGRCKQQTLIRPVNIVADNVTSFMILDQGNKVIFDVENDKSTIPKCIRMKDNYFTSLIGICKKPDNEILFTDSRLNKVYVMSANNKRLKALNDTLKLNHPNGIAYSPLKKEIWVVETNAHRISVLNEKGEIIKTIGRRGDDKGQFNFPTSIWIDQAGDTYVVDAMNFRVQIFNKEGEFITMFGEVGDVSGTFARPKGIATDGFGNIYIVDGLFHVVQIFDREGHFLYKFGEQGKGKEQFWLPGGIYIDNRNYIYVADSYNSRVQVFQLINGDKYEKITKQ